MSGSKENSRKPDMNWLQIDAILRNMVKAWNGSESAKQDILKAASKKFNWTERQSSVALDMHFNNQLRKRS
jgi:hypothetical protein